MDHLEDMLSSLSISNGSSSSVSSYSSFSCCSSTFITSSILNVSNYEDNEGTSRYKIDPVNLVGKIGAVIICFLIITGIVGNLLVLTVIIQTRHLRRSYNVLIASLSVTDLIFNTFIMPFYVDSYLYRRWRFTDALCRFETYFGTMTVMTSAFHIGLIAANRFFLIVLPGWYPSVSSGRALIFQVGLAWLMALGVVLPGALGWNAVVRYSDQIGRCSYLRSESRISLFLVFNFGFICPCAVMCFCYFMIWNVTRRSRRKLANHTHRTNDRTPALVTPGGHGQSSAEVVKSSTNDLVLQTSRRNIAEDSQSANEMQRLRCHGDEVTRSASMIEELLRSDDAEPVREDAQEAEDGVNLQRQFSNDDVDHSLLVMATPAPPPLPQLPVAAAEQHHSTEQRPHPEMTHSTTGIDSLHLSVAESAANAETTSLIPSSPAAVQPNSPLKQSSATDHSSMSEAYNDLITDTPELLPNESLKWKSVGVERFSKTNLDFLEDNQLLPIVRPLPLKPSQTETGLATTDKSQPLLLHSCVPHSPSQTKREDEEEEGEECDREKEQGQEAEEEEEKEEGNGVGGYDVNCAGAETVIETGLDGTDQRNENMASVTGINSGASTTHSGFVALNRSITENCFEPSEEHRVSAEQTRAAPHQRVRRFLRLLRCRLNIMTKQGPFHEPSGSFSRAPDVGPCQCAVSLDAIPGPCNNGQLTGFLDNPSAAPPFSLSMTPQVSVGDGVRFASGPIHSSHAQDRYRFKEEGVNVAAYNSEFTIRQGICQSATKIPKLVKQNDDNGTKVCRQVTRSSQRSVKMILVIFVAFLLTYLPFTIMNLADEHSILDRHWYMITSLGFWSGSCVNPLIYGIMNRQFRAAYGAIFMSCRKAILKK